MKTLVLALLVSVTASAWNRVYEKAAYGEITVVKTKKNNSGPEVVSIKIDTRTKNGAEPVVANYTPWQNVCEHKKTLLTFAGFDAKTREYVRTYEVQVALSSNRYGKTCSILIKPAKDSLIQESARVSIL